MLYMKKLCGCALIHQNRFRSQWQTRTRNPQNNEMSAAEVHALDEHLEELRKHGIEAEVFGPTTILLRSPEHAAQNQFDEVLYRPSFTRSWPHVDNLKPWPCAGWLPLKPATDIRRRY